MSISSLISGIGGETALIAGFVGFLMLIVLVAPTILAAQADRARLRSSMIERHRAKLREESLRRERGARYVERPQIIGHLLQLVKFIPDRFRLEKMKLLRSAGFIDSRAIYAFWLAKVFFLAVGLSMLLGLLTLSKYAAVDIYLLGAVAFLAFFGFFLPDFFVKKRQEKRLRRIERGLPDGLDLLVICAEAGLSLDSALKRVADEFAGMVPELAEELLLTSIELNFLPERRQALLNLAQRIDVPAIRGVTATLIQTEKYGTPLAQALRTLASEFRENRLLRAEDKAARLPAILTVPMIVFILPALFVVLAAPAFIKVSEKMIN